MPFREEGKASITEAPLDTRQPAHFSHTQYTSNTYVSTIPVFFSFQWYHCFRWGVCQVMANGPGRNGFPDLVHGILLTVREHNMQCVGMKIADYDLRRYRAGSSLSQASFSEIWKRPGTCPITAHCMFQTDVMLSSVQSNVPGRWPMSTSVREATQWSYYQDPSFTSWKTQAYRSWKGRLRSGQAHEHCLISIEKPKDMNKNTPTKGKSKCQDVKPQPLFSNVIL